MLLRLVLYVVALACLGLCYESYFFLIPDCQPAIEGLSLALPLLAQVSLSLARPCTALGVPVALLTCLGLPLLGRTRRGLALTGVVLALLLTTGLLPQLAMRQFLAQLNGSTDSGKLSLADLRNLGRARADLDVMVIPSLIWLQGEPQQLEYRVTNRGHQIHQFQGLQFSSVSPPANAEPVQQAVALSPGEVAAANLTINFPQRPTTTPEFRCSILGVLPSQATIPVLAKCRNKPH